MLSNVKRQRLHSTADTASLYLTIIHLSTAFSPIKALSAIKALSPILALLLLAPNTWGFETDHDSTIGASGSPKNLTVYGQVGIGTPAAGDRLEINGKLRFSNINSDWAKIYYESLGSNGDQSDSGNNLVFETADDHDEGFLFRTTCCSPHTKKDIVYIKAPGGEHDHANKVKVGIGTTSPEETLHVDGTVKATSFKGDGSQLTGISGAWNSDNNSNIYYDAGNVAIGYSSPQNGIRLAVDGPIAGTLLLVGNQYTVNNDAAIIHGDLIVNGNILYDGSLSYISDLSFKKNIEPITNSLQKLQQIDGVYFDWQDQTQASKQRRQIGVIAQAVEAQFPELVMENKEGYKSVAYSNLSAVLIEAIKELKASNDALESAVTDLKTRLQILEAK